ncbi:MAG: universal stress protein [Haloarculaceae archaeon]
MTLGRSGARPVRGRFQDPRKRPTRPHAEEITEGRKAIAQRTCNEVSVHGIEVDPAVRADVPQEAILRYARAHDADLVVMGTHGRTGVERFLLGSVTETLLRLSDVPVLTINEEEDEAGGIGRRPRSGPSTTTRSAARRVRRRTEDGGGCAGNLNRRYRCGLDSLRPGPGRTLHRRRPERTHLALKGRLHRDRRRPERPHLARGRCSGYPRSLRSLG